MSAVSDRVERTTEVRLTATSRPVTRLGPRSLERPSDQGSTLVGLYGDPLPASVDRAGLIHHPTTSWSLDWWIGAEDRWHFPARESTIRQRRLGAGPVIETVVRVPGGDAIHRCYRAVVQGAAATIVEVENGSGTPVALALALRPYDLVGTPSPHPTKIEVVDDQVFIDEAAALGLPRPPNDMSVSLSDPLVRLQAGEGLDGDALVAGIGAHAVLVFALPHRTMLRFVLPVVPTTKGCSVATAPEHDSVSRGWTAVVERGGRFVLPDNGLSARAAAARARLVVEPFPEPTIESGTIGTGTALIALAASGAEQIVSSALSRFADSFPSAVVSAPAGSSVMHAIGWAACARGDRSLAERLLEPATQLVRLVERADRSRTSSAVAEALRGLAWVCRAAGQFDDAERLFARARLMEGGLGRRDRKPLSEVEQQATQAGGAGAFGCDDFDRAARFWLDTRRLMLDEAEPGGDGRAVLELLPNFATAWRGGGIEVHRARSPLGIVSFAVRWHGYRPALLWDVEAWAPDLELRCSGLDPEWVTGEPRGEALLAGVASALPDAPSAGDSFL